VKIWHKILLGYLLVAVFISLSVVPNARYYGRIREAFRNFKEGDIVAVDTLEQMEKTLLEMDSSVRLFQATRDDGAEKNYREARNHWLVLREQLATLLSDEIDPSLVEKMDAASLDWIRTTDQFLGRRKSGTPPSSIDPVRLTYVQIIQWQRGHLDHSYDHALQTVDQGGYLSWVLLAVAALLGLLTSLVVVRAVRTPLDRLTRATEDVAAGRFEPIEVETSDELGQLTNAFNHMSDSLKERTAALEEQRRIAVQANELKTEFLANTSHELRTPLNTIMGYSQLILEGLARTKEEERSYLATIQQSSRQLLTLINDVLDIARIESGQMKLDLEPVLLKQVFTQVDEHMNLPAKQKSLALKVDMPQEDVWVHANPVRLTQVLLNIVGNAIKFTHAGSVHVTASSQNGEVRLTVKDTGIGIPAEKQRRLFQKFVQADGSVTRHYRGTGLGLALSKTLLQLMDGTIELQSEGEGKGVTVFITLKKDQKLF